MPEALPRLQRVDDLIAMDEVHRAGADDVHPLRRLTILDQRGRARGQRQELGGVGRGPPLSVVDCVEGSLMGEEPVDLVGFGQDPVTR